MAVLWIFPGAFLASAISPPCGNLETRSIFLIPPDEILEQLDVPSQQTEWQFIGYTTQDLIAFFESAGLTNSQLNLLIDVSRWHFDADKIRIFPRPEVVEGLSPGSRSMIYRVLGKWTENYFHRRPIVFENDDLEQWFANTPVSPSVVELIETLSYRRGETLLFSDLPFLLQLIDDSEKERDLLRTLTRSRTLVTQLIVDSKTNFDRLIHFWTAAGAHNTSLPLLQSIRLAGTKRSLDITHLLPSIPRKNVFNYPYLRDGFEGRYPDSMWTAVNFFSRIPSEIYRDGLETNQFVRERFQPIHPPFQFGDILFLVKTSNNDVAHACVYLGDDIVYTKNGPGILSPWVQSKIKDTIRFHQREDPLYVSGWRSNAVVAALQKNPGL